MKKSELLNIIRDAGIVGAGGGGFPAYKKLESKIEHVIANGVECEPLLYKDREVMLQEAERLIRGLEIVREITDASKVTIAVKRKNIDVAEMLKPIAGNAGMEIFLMENVYPAGDEFILVYDITGKRIPPGGIPLMVGCLVDNVETLVNIAKAFEDKPVTEKFITISGAVRNPVTTSVPIGTSYKDCIDFAGGFIINNPVILTGGVMMGGMETDLSKSVSRTLAGLIILPEYHNLVQRKTASKKTYNKTGHSTCDQCTFCTQLCPRYILGYPIQPHLVMRSLLMTGKEKERLSLWAANCCECNICSFFACPEKLDPKNICAETKQRLKIEKIGFSKAELERVFKDVHPARDGRGIPITNLYQRLGIKQYDRKADFKKFDNPIKEVLIPLTNYFGNKVTPVVKLNEKVNKGDKISSLPDNEFGVPVHSSIKGTVTKILSEGILITTL